MRFRLFVVGLLLCSALMVGTSGVAVAGTVVARWPMDEKSGTVMHDVVGGHNGTIYAATLGVSGFLQSAYQFSQSKARVVVPSAPALSPGSANMTIVAHVKLTQRPSSGDYDVLKKGDYSTPGGEYKVEILQSGQALCGFKGSATYAQVSGGPNLATGHWFTITCIKTAGAVTLQVAGKTFTNNRAVGSISNSAPLGIGAAPNSDYYKGTLDEVSVSVG